MSEYEDEAESESEGEEKPELAKPYLDKISRAEKYFANFNLRADNIEKLYADMKSLADVNGDREYQIFWANMEVLRPTIYTRPPVPVVAPRNKDVPEVHRKAAELLERVLTYDAEADDLHETLMQVRDDLALTARGVPWVLDNGVCIHVERKDFLHEPARKWKEVGWVARCAYLTKDQGVERFGDKFLKAKCQDYGIGRDNDKTYAGEKKAKVWEFWCKSENEVVWFTEGVEEVLETSEPLVDVKGFYPCPRPAFGTLEKSTMLPVPDFAYYRDQVDEINSVTARIHKLSDSLRVKGFYAAGVSELGEAIETAMKSVDNGQILVPVSNLQLMGGPSLKDSVVWLPVTEVANTVKELVALRQQLISDVYEITGLSDIMRGSTQASETATAQNLKAQYGSIRVQSKQGEMQRIARDIFRIKGEIFAENAPIDELMAIAQMPLPSEAEVQMQAQAAAVQGQQMDTSKIVTKEAVDQLFKGQKTRPFVLEVETDSTIAPNEEAEKAARTEFVTTMGTLISQAGPMVMQFPEGAPLVVDTLKFAAGAFRAGRELMSTIDEFGEKVKAKAEQAANPPPPQPPPPDPALVKAESDQKIAADKLAFDRETRDLEMDMQREKLKADSASAALAAGVPPDYSFNDDRAQFAALMQAMAQQGQQNQALLQTMLQNQQANMQAMMAMIQAINTPKQVVRDANGEVIGVAPVMVN